MKKILFVCVENSCRSQIAEGFAKALGGLKLEVYSAGSKPGGKVSPDAVKVMREIGIDISTAKSKGFNDLPAKEFDYVVTMGCKDICPLVPAKEHIDWNIEDPKGKDEKFFRKTRDLIKEKVESLIREV
ncbi:MAG: arsenate reductase ArsC [Candidatus Omnitrophota bacterium]